MPSIFISYRREDTSGAAGRLADDLAQRFGRSRIFMDLDSIVPGVNFEDRMREALNSCQVALVLIGQRWLTATLRNGERRIDAPDDYVRQEIAASLARADVTVVPVLVDGAQMPSAAQLPSEISALSKINAFELSNKRWRSEVAELGAIAQRHDRGWRRLRRPLPRSARWSLPLVALVVAGAVALVVVTRGGSTTDIAARIAACEHTHGMATAQVTRSPGPGETSIDSSTIFGLPAGIPLSFTQQTFASCTWPPAPGADPDGYRAITATHTNGPGLGHASGRDNADRIESHCPTLRLDYTSAFMFHQTRLPQIGARHGDILELTGANLKLLRLHRVGEIGTRSGDALNLPFYPGRNEVVVLGDDSLVLDNVQCAA